MIGVLALLTACCLWSSAAAARLEIVSRGSVSRKIKQDTAAWEVDRQRGSRGAIPFDPAAGKCKAVSWESHLVVAARCDEDVSWMATDLTPWQQYVVYNTRSNGSATHKTGSDTGRESQAYLQFISDYYECLPQTVVFIHAHRSSPHSPDMVSDLKRLQWQAIPGFMSMSRPQRLNTFYFSEPEKQSPDPSDPSETAHWMQFAFEQNELIRKIWPELFQEALGNIPPQLTAPGSGQFAVTKANLRRHSQAFYQRALKWLQTTDVDGFWAGLIFEQLWSYILGAGTEYRHPDECTVFMCTPEGAAIIPRWETVGSRKLNSPRSIH